jgi:tRNA pseudouridine38-40 synthase
MSRYFAELAYHGAAYHGWQKQPNGTSVQETIETALAMLLRKPVSTTGCGRTDTGVHARRFFLHFDEMDPLPEDLTERLNRALPPDINIFRIFPVADEAHARYDATSRSYTYHISLQKDPFAQGLAYYFVQAATMDITILQKAADILPAYDDFFPFCKSRGAAKTTKCRITRVAWEFSPDGQQLLFHITADRFLRGMVRLIVGMCLNVATGKITLEDVRAALDEQRMIKKSLSVPAEGLFLTEVRYPFL